MDPNDYQKIRQLLDDYLRMYAQRDDLLTTFFSEDFSGFTGGGDFLVKNREEWIAITRQDFAQVKEPIRIELKDLAIQSLAETTAVATSFFAIHLPIKDHILSRETARLVLVFHKESAGWKISHSSISIPYGLVGQGEIYPLKELVKRNRHLEEVVAERTRQLSEANDDLRQANEKLGRAFAEHKQTDDALQRSEGLYKSILNASPDDITITDLQGRILMASPMAFKMFRVDPDYPFLGLPVTDLIVPEDRARALSQIALRNQGLAIGANAYRALRPDGSTFDIEVNSGLIRNAQGAPTDMVFIVRDITERKRGEADKEKLEAQNRQLHKSESLGRMAGAIAHTFNSQLCAVIGNLDLALMDLPENTGFTENILAAKQSAENVSAVSGQMLAYLGQSFGKRELLDVCEACKESLSFLRAILPEKVALETNLPSPGPVISANRNQIQQVLTSLVTNAWEAMDEKGGAIHLEVKTVSWTAISVTHRHPLHWEPQDHDYVCLELRDTGSGIADKDMENLFDPFFSSKFAGRGMGLAVVMGIVQAHGGVVAVESKIGQGSTFRVFFPVYSEDLLK